MATPRLSSDDSDDDMDISPVFSNRGTMTGRQNDRSTTFLLDKSRDLRKYLAPPGSEEPTEYPNTQTSIPLDDQTFHPSPTQLRLADETNFRLTQIMKPETPPSHYSPYNPQIPLHNQHEQPPSVSNNHYSPHETNDTTFFLSDTQYRLAEDPAFLPTNVIPKIAEQQQGMDDTTFFVSDTQLRMAYEPTNMATNIVGPMSTEKINPYRESSQGIGSNMFDNSSNLRDTTFYGSPTQFRLAEDINYRATMVMNPSAQKDLYSGLDLEEHRQTLHEQTLFPSETQMNMANEPTFFPTNIMGDASGSLSNRFSNSLPADDSMTNTTFDLSNTTGFTSMSASRPPLVPQSASSRQPITQMRTSYGLDSSRTNISDISFESNRNTDMMMLAGFSPTNVSRMSLQQGTGTQTTPFREGYTPSTERTQFDKDSTQQSSQPASIAQFSSLFSHNQPLPAQRWNETEDARLMPPPTSHIPQPHHIPSQQPRQPQPIKVDMSNPELLAVLLGMPHRMYDPTFSFSNVNISAPNPHLQNVDQSQLSIKDRMESHKFEATHRRVWNKLTSLRQERQKELQKEVRLTHELMGRLAAKYPFLGNAEDLVRLCAQNPPTDTLSREERAHKGILLLLQKVKEHRESQGLSTDALTRLTEVGIPPAMNTKDISFQGEVEESLRMIGEDSQKVADAKVAADARLMKLRNKLKTLQNNLEQDRREIQTLERQRNTKKSGTAWFEASTTAVRTRRRELATGPPQTTIHFPLPPTLEMSLRYQNGEFLHNVTPVFVSASRVVVEMKTTFPPSVFFSHSSNASRLTNPVSVSFQISLSQNSKPEPESPLPDLPRRTTRRSTITPVPTYRPTRMDHENDQTEVNCHCVHSGGLCSLIQTVVGCLRSGFADEKGCFPVSDWVYTFCVDSNLTDSKQTFGRHFPPPQSLVDSILVGIRRVMGVINEVSSITPSQGLSLFIHSLCSVFTS
ncbi:hypothetical protein BLNAU_7605 [Blattamonas nauphoetae]|uniref:BHLH domain-containing protein n=1 Tax=Blattamonas nauphoetae TaxID=2049346 RepID=A0ABQ9Y145_9EUKA|nr:hypothetical protein BLNAU_7605 [Blattamonas nauphoetae]